MIIFNMNRITIISIITIIITINREYGNFENDNLTSYAYKWTPMVFTKIIQK